MHDIALMLWNEFLPIVTTILVTVAIPALIGLAVKWFAKLGVDIDAKHRDALQTALQNAAALILARFGGGIAPPAATIPQEAISYVQRAAPGALKHFGMEGNTAAIAEKIRAKLPQVAAHKPGV